MALEIIRHCDITHEDLLRVIEIKNTVWSHPLESQLKWIEENLFAEDLHIILEDQGNDLAYMNLCLVSAVVDEKPVQFYGIGNVCTKTHGLGHGRKLMECVNAYLTHNNFMGLLFCMDKVMHFYSRYGWRVISSDSIISIRERRKDVYTMCYNIPPFKKLIYSDRDF